MKYYLAGIKGENMARLAILLSDLGYEVDCYEDEEYEDERLAERGITIYNNLHELNENSIVVYSELEEGHRVFLKAKELNLKVYSYSDIVEKLVHKFNTICISGCHGKTTTANILKEILDSNYMIDKDVYGNKELSRFIYEEKELDSVYEPEYILITNMETSNKEDYGNIDNMINKYQEYASRASKMVIACGDDPYTHTLNVNTQIFYYGINDDNDITARDVEYNENGTIFDVYVEDEFYGHFELPIYGKHMLLDTLAALSICHYERVDIKDVSRKLKEYKFLKEENINDNIVIKDSAKDEIEIKATIKGIKQKYPEKEVFIVNSNFEIDNAKTIKEKDIDKFSNSVILELEG